MYKKAMQTAFVVLFLLMLAIPAVTTNLKKNQVSEAERRKLAARPELYKDDGSLNREFTSDFETWINDNIGFRSRMVIHNAELQFYLFRVLANNSDMLLGPKGELNYATKEMITDYQHLNLYSEEQLREVAGAMQQISDYAEKDGAQFYYYQCWDKHSIYPEYFPDTVLQYGDVSKTDGIVRALREYSDVKVISPKQELLDGKKSYDTYSVWGDPTHWTPRGAYIGYRLLMESLNAHAETPYRILEESDYEIKITDQGRTVFGGIHKEDQLEEFELKAPKAVLTNEKLTVYAEDKSHSFYTNESAGNRTRLLILGDSYFNSFIVDDIAESFYETVLIWGDYDADIKTILDAYHPDLVIVENAERCDRLGELIKGAKKIGAPD